MGVFKVGTNCCKEECCETSSESESKCPCGKPGCDGSNCDPSYMIMKTANEAWTELLRDKMKVQFEKSMGKQMDAMAQAGVEASMTFHMNKMKDKTSMEESMNKIRKSFSM